MNLKKWLTTFSMVIILLVTAARLQAATTELGELDQTPYVHALSGAVSESAPQCTYTFTLQSRCDFTFRLRRITSEASAYLQNEAGEILATSNHPGNDPEAILMPLEPGNYLVVVQKRSPVAANFIAEFSALFIANEVVVSGNLDIPDPEYDYIGNHVAWRTDNNQLMVARIDPRTGFFDLAGRQMLDSGLANSRDVVNGPEWAFGSTGSRILYTKENNDGVWSISQARLIDASWTVEHLAGTANGYKPIGSLEPTDEIPLVKYVLGSAGNRKESSEWKELDRPGFTGTVAPGANIEAGRWGPGERSIYVSWALRGVYQVARYDIDTGLLTAQTTDYIQKLLPFAIRSPDFRNEVVVTTADTDDEKAGYYNSIGVYRTVPGTNTRQNVKRILSPVPELPAIQSPEPFVFNGHSYVSFLTGPPVSKDSNGRKRDAQIWIASLDPASDFVRRISPADAGRFVLSDPEFFVTPEAVFIYYAELVGGVRVIHRAATGLDRSYEP